MGHATPRKSGHSADSVLAHYTNPRVTNESLLHADGHFLHQMAPRGLRVEDAPAGPSQPPARPLSSADETGPVQKRLRSTTRQRSVDLAKSKPSKLVVEEPLKKARARPALKFANIFSSPGRRSQPIQNLRSVVGVGKNERHPGNNGVGPRRSTRLLSGPMSKQAGKVRFSSCYYMKSSILHEDAELFHFTAAPTSARTTSTPNYNLTVAFNRVRSRRGHCCCRRCGVFYLASIKCSITSLRYFSSAKLLDLYS